MSVLGISVLAAVGTSTEAFSDNVNATIRVLISLVTFVVIGLVLTGLSRLAVARHDYVGRSWPGAFSVAFMWQGLQFLGTIYATKVLAGTSSMNQTFGLVLGLIGLIYLAAVMGVLGIEINVVLARRLYPRSLATLFTDRVDLTDADRRTYAGLVHMNALKGFESVAVRFDERNGDTHEIVLEPKTPPRGTPVLSPQDQRTEAGRTTQPLNQSGDGSMSGSVQDGSGVGS